jgi:hypothetical protein
MIFSEEGWAYLMEVIIQIEHILLIVALVTVITGFIAWMFKLWKEFNQLKTGMAYRQTDMVMMFRCLRLLLEIGSGAKVNGRTEKALIAVNRFIDTRAAGMRTEFDDDF